MKLLVWYSHSIAILDPLTSTSFAIPQSLEKIHLSPNGCWNHVKSCEIHTVCWFSIPIFPWENSVHFGYIPWSPRCHQHAGGAESCAGGAEKPRLLFFLFFVYHYIIYLYTLWYVHYNIYIITIIYHGDLYIYNIHTYIHTYVYLLLYFPVYMII